VLGRLSLANQAFAINLLLLLLPCLVGVVFGAPLVAGELEHKTNRLAWTQGISRTRWFVSKCLVVGLILVGLAALLAVVAQWWSSHTFDAQGFSLDVGHLHLGTGETRIGPQYFAITGIVPVAYTLFAFGLGAALGAFVRRTSWAIVGTVVGYTAVALLMVLVVRPSLVPPSFSANQNFNSGFSVGVPTSAWDLGEGFRFAPGTHTRSGASAGAIAQTCQDRNNMYAPYLRCLVKHDVQAGAFFQPAKNYWALQWREATIYVAASIVLLGVAYWAVRRWRA
jgi:hypothetical protein